MLHNNFFTFGYMYCRVSKRLEEKKQETFFFRFIGTGIYVIHTSVQAYKCYAMLFLYRQIG
jgi:hypothetical protein